MFTLLWKLFLSCVSTRAAEGRVRETLRANLERKTSWSLSLKDLNKSVFTCSDPLMSQFEKPKALQLSSVQAEFQWGKTILLRLAVHAEAKVSARTFSLVWTMKGNDCNSGKLYNINLNLRRASRGVGGVQWGGTAGTFAFRENIQQFCNLYSWWHPHNYSSEQMLHEGHSWLNYDCFLIPFSLLASSPHPHLQKWCWRALFFFIKGPEGRVSVISPRESSFKVYLCFVILAGLQKRL